MNLRSITLLVLTVFVVGVLGWVVLSGPPSAGTVTETENQESLSPLDAAVVDSATSREDQVVGVHSKQGYSGSVLDKNGKAIPGAWVALIAPTPFGDWGMQRTDLLDKSGERQSCGLGGNFFLAAKEGSGPWQVLAGAPGFGVQRSGEMTSWLTGSAATFVLQPEVEVEGRVILEKGDAVAEAVVQLRALRGTRLDGMPNVVRTDSTGSFRVVA
ncbi:MAG: hypothetical protein MK213_06860, partial [Planctomycetes bacterium]|nr:hypothetical protein [Planctomycetota bacterium]